MNNKLWAFETSKIMINLLSVISDPQQLTQQVHARHSRFTRFTGPHTSRSITQVTGPQTTRLVTQATGPRSKAGYRSTRHGRSQVHTTRQVTGPHTTWQVTQVHTRHTRSHTNVQRPRIPKAEIRTNCYHL